MECRVLCEGSQRFEEYEYLGYKGGFYEVIVGKVFFDFLIVYFKVLQICEYFDNIVYSSKYCKMLKIFMGLFYFVFC